MAGVGKRNPSFPRNSALGFRSLFPSRLDLQWPPEMAQNLARVEGRRRCRPKAHPDPDCVFSMQRDELRPGSAVVHHTWMWHHSHLDGAAIYPELSEKPVCWANEECKWGWGVGACLTYLRESLFSSTLAPSFARRRMSFAEYKPYQAGQRGASGASDGQHFVLTAGDPGTGSTAQREGPPERRLSPDPRSCSVPRVPKATPLLILSPRVCKWKARKLNRWFLRSMATLECTQLFCGITEFFFF